MRQIIVWLTCCLAKYSTVLAAAELIFLLILREGSDPVHTSWFQWLRQKFLFLSARGRFLAELTVANYRVIVTRAIVLIFLRESLHGEEELTARAFLSAHLHGMQVLSELLLL